MLVRKSVIRIIRQKNRVFKWFQFNYGPVQSYKNYYDVKIHIEINKNRRQSGKQKLMYYTLHVIRIAIANAYYYNSDV